MILANFVALVIGYLVGSINLSIIFSRKKRKEDIRTKGSYNAGSTNALRVYGAKFALPIFIFDILKALIVVVSVSLVNTYATSSPIYASSLIYLVPQIGGLGVVIGHIWPLYFKFKGGKGAASLLGLIISMNLIVTIIGVILFLAVVFWTRYISVGSIFVPIVLIAISFAPWFILGPLGWFNWRPLGHENLYWINPLVVLISHFFVIFSHKSNIIRLFKGTENKFSAKK
ncbi:glycerol-3-phosphate 1-O-acyltransferase PlsY [Mycoplasma procyoni]|uniref:glycerol-3-phosphate 1-O-acyltransferase PlsY n=1 Tax=Mycoplasma procyoni TaxID=568784 RepID=UPI00197B0CE4|nr:glycerol-3-phosphate 1-O-acyltransferase PlsY [Mycoplasma procyoni]MBN3534402.1 glycerol-3-phosphate 1-O-acyltransferase PlsY [Mycoplasma procyoni]